MLAEYDLNYRAINRTVWEIGLDEQVNAVIRNFQRKHFVPEVIGNLPE